MSRVSPLHRLPHPAPSALRSAFPREGRRAALAGAHVAFSASLCSVAFPETPSGELPAPKGNGRSRAPTGRPGPLARQPSYAPPPGGGGCPGLQLGAQGTPDGAPGLHTGDGTRKGRKPSSPGWIDSAIWASLLRRIRGSEKGGEAGMGPSSLRSPANRPDSPCQGASGAEAPIGSIAPLGARLTCSGTSGLPTHTFLVLPGL